MVRAGAMLDAVGFESFAQILGGGARLDERRAQVIECRKESARFIDDVERGGFGHSSPIGFSRNARRGNVIGFGSNKAERQCLPPIGHE